MTCVLCNRYLRKGEYTKCPNCGHIYTEEQLNTLWRIPQQDLTFITQLKELCLLYDKTYGDYPESEFEGEAILTHVLETISNKYNIDFTYLFNKWKYSDNEMKECKNVHDK